MKKYWGSRGTAPRILNLGTRWRWVVSFTSLLLYPWGPREYEAEWTPKPVWMRWREHNPGYSARSLVTILTELPGMGGWGSRGDVIRHRWEVTEQFVVCPLWSSTRRLPLDKLTVTQLVKKFPAFRGTRRFITVFTTARHWSISWDNYV